MRQYEARAILGSNEVSYMHAPPHRRDVVQTDIDLTVCCKYWRGLVGRSLREHVCARDVFYSKNSDRKMIYEIQCLTYRQVPSFTLISSITKC